MQLIWTIKQATEKKRQNQNDQLLCLVKREIEQERPQGFREDVAEASVFVS